MIREFLDLKRNAKIRNKNLIENCKDLLIPGTYYTTLMGDQIELQSADVSHNLTTFSSTSGTRGKMIDCVRKWIVKQYPYNVCDEKNSFNGSTLLISSSEKEIKIFDYKANILITKYLEESRYQAALEHKQFFAEYFPVIPYIKNDIQGFILAEPIISKIDFDAEYAFKEILSKYVIYLSSIPHTMGEPLISERELRNFEKIFNTMIERSVLRAPVSCVHGDLWSENIIFDGTVFYWLDFEHISTRYCMYDIFFYMFSEEFMKGNDTILGNYLLGKYDTEFTALFSSVNMIYEPNKRTEYLKLFVAIIYSVRWKTIKSPKIKLRIYKIMKHHKIL